MAHPKDQKIDLKILALFVPVAYFSYLFHEFGHWTVGELMGNDMALSLNYAWPKNGAYPDPGHDLYVSLGGPIFTILQASAFLLVLHKYRSIYIYPLLFFPMFMRLFSLLFGGFANQDEARISLLLHAGAYTVAIVVMLILILVVVSASRLLRINLKTNGYFFTISTLCQLLVIATYRFL